MKSVSLYLSSTLLFGVLNGCGDSSSTSSDNRLYSDEINIENKENSSDTTFSDIEDVPRLKKYSEWNREGQLTKEIEFFYKNDKLVRMENRYPPRYNYTFTYKGDNIIIDISPAYDNVIVKKKMLYSGSKFLGWIGYKEIEENKVKEFQKLEVLSYDGIKPLVTKYLPNIDSQEEIDWRKTRSNVIYDGEYVIQAEGFFDGEYENSYEYNRSHKCITWKDLVGVELQYLFKKSNRCENWTSLTGTLDGTGLNSTQDITYNEDNLPVRMKKKVYSLDDINKVYKYY